MKNNDIMLEGIFCVINDKDKEKLKKIRNEFLESFNSTLNNDFETRSSLVKKYFGNVGCNAFVEKPFYCDYGANINVGDNLYIGHDCNILDVTKVFIGNNVYFGPNVSIYTAAHIDNNTNENLEYGVSIGSDVWVGGNTVITPGVNIGSNVIIGSYSVVVSDIPSNSMVSGNPCKVLRELNENETRYLLEQVKLGNNI